MLMMSRNVSMRIACCALVLAVAPWLFGRQQGAPPADFANVELRVLPVQGSVHMLYAGSAGNIAVHAGKDGVLLVDALYGALAPRIAAEVRKITPSPIRYIINTSADAHHVDGNAALAATGVFGATPAAGRGATILAHENVLNRLTRALTGEARTSPQRGLPNSEYFGPQKDFYFNGEPIFVFHEPNARTDGDSIVLFRKSDTIAAGDLFTPGRYPVIDVAKGGSVQGFINALNHVLDLAVPERLQDAGTRIVPGHGRLSNEADVVEFRDMAVIIRDRIRDMIRKGMTLDQVRSARPTRDYDPEFGSGDQLVEAMYRSLTAAR